VTHVRGLKARTERKDVITDEEFKEMLHEAKKIPEHSIDSGPLRCSAFSG
jgi:hypothetical protein